MSLRSSRQLESRWVRVRGSLVQSPERAIQTAVSLLDEAFPKRSTTKSAATEGYPFDAELLKLSPLYKKSRALFQKSGGKFRANMVSSPRSLGSASLLDSTIEYSPIERELRWASTDPLQKKERDHLIRLKSYAGSLFHEQNHRILWSLLPPPSSEASIRQYLNFAESLVIALDFALGDQLYPLSEMFWQFHACYDPGTSVLKESRAISKREYRNYLQAAVVATFLTLELYDPKKIPRAIQMLFPGNELALRAAHRATLLDEKFVVTTNRIWQKRHAKSAYAQLKNRGRGKKALMISKDPLDQAAQYLFAENWFELFGL